MFTPNGVGIYSFKKQYIINVYATKLGFDNSDIATATLCWLDTEPKTEGMTNNIATARGNAILIQNHNGILNVMGVQDGVTINVYTPSGLMVGSAKVSGTSTSIGTNLCCGEIAIVKIGDNSVKVVIYIIQLRSSASRQVQSCKEAHKEVNDHYERIVQRVWREIDCFCQKCFPDKKFFCFLFAYSKYFC